MIRVGRGAHNGIDSRGVYHVDGVFEALDAVLLGNRKAECARRVGAGNDLAALKRVVDAFVWVRPMPPVPTSPILKVSIIYFSFCRGFPSLRAIPQGEESDMH